MYIGQIIVLYIIYGKCDWEKEQRGEQDWEREERGELEREMCLSMQFFHLLNKFEENNC